MSVKVVDVLARDDCTLARGERLQRHEGHNGVILVDDTSWPTTGHDITEGTGHR
jgi:hypothetical protein